MMKRVLITGAHSYIGESFREFLEQFPDQYIVSKLATRGLKPTPEQFEGIDVIFCVAGIAHIKETDENRHLYYVVNRDLVVEMAKAAKTAGVRQFVLLSSMSVYGLTVGHITKDTKPNPKTAYGESKLQADEAIQELEDSNFIFTCLRPPMVYGKNCTGNYQALRKFALKSPIFPNYTNERSMVYIGNLCQFVKDCIDFEKSGLFFPQNREYVNTSQMVKMVADLHRKHIILTKMFNWVIRILPMGIFRKVFGDLTYELVDTIDKYGFSESIALTEGIEAESADKTGSTGSSNHLRLEHFIKHNRIVQNLYRFGMSAVFRVASRFIKTDENLVLMNGHGYKYNDSPRAIYRKMCELGLTKKYNVVWALNEPDKADIPGCTKIKMDTMEYFKTAMRAKYWISCVNIERALHFKKNNQIYLNTWHGAAINVCGNGVSNRSDFHWGYIDYFCVCGKYDEINFGRDLELNPASFLRTGLPRNDDLYHISKESQKKMQEKLGLPSGKKYVLYAPTWRESEDGGNSYQLAPPIDWERWKNELGNEYVVMLRTHPYTTRLMKVQFNDFVLDYTEYPEVNDLLIAADVLISDYSSINLDYCITGKPMICFGYDYDEYNKSRGFYYDLEKEMPNGVMRTEEEVINHLKNLDYDADVRRTVSFKNRHCEYGEGNATVQCINKVFGTDFE